MLDYSEDFLYSAGICGHKGFCILGGILDGLGYDTKFYSHEGPFGVGYMVCLYLVNDSNGKKYLNEWLDNKKEIVNFKNDVYSSVSSILFHTRFKGKKTLEENLVELIKLVDARIVDLRIFLQTVS